MLLSVLDSCMCALLLCITSAYVYGMQEEPHGNRGRNGGPQCLRVKLQCIPLAVCLRAISMKRLTLPM